MKIFTKFLFFVLLCFQFLEMSAIVSPPLPNDDCVSAITIATNPTVVVYGTNEMATADPVAATACTASSQNHVWYKFSVTEPTDVEIQVCGLPNAEIIAFSGACGSLIPYSCGVPSSCSGNSILYMYCEPPPAGVKGLEQRTTSDYFIAVGSNSTDTAPFTLNMSFVPVPPPAPPMNDLCTSANLITPTQSAQVYFGTNVGATGDGLGCLPFDNQVWYKFDVEQTEDFTVSTCYTSFDSKIAVYYGDCGSLTFVNCNANNTSCNFIPYGQVVFRADPNPLKGGSVLETRAPRTYYLAIGSNAVDEGSIQFAVYKEAVFPITLSSFYGKNNGETNILEWITSSEKNVAYFALERSSNGQSNWQVIEKITAQGNISEVKSYETTDKNPFPLSYYRLRVEDKNGEVNYTKIVSIENHKIKRSVLIFPNPSKGKFNIQGIELDDQRVILWNSLGQKWESKIHENNLDLTDRPNGIYFIQIGSNIQIFKIHKL